LFTEKGVNIAAFRQRFNDLCRSRGCAIGADHSTSIELHGTLPPDNLTNFLLLQKNQPQLRTA
jgi:hypothetical protein